MSILYLLIPLAVVLMLVAALFFLWTVKTGQYDDLEGPAYRILMDDDDPMIPGQRHKMIDNKSDPLSAEPQAVDKASPKTRA